MCKKVQFYDLEEATYQGGFLVSDIIKILGVSRRTWYRWKEKKEAPKWALEVVNVKSGDLTELGWKGYYIKQGVIYNSGLNPKYYNWTPADLMVTVFCGCHSHKYIREQRKNRIDGSLPIRPSKALPVSLYTRESQSLHSVIRK